MKDRCCGNCKHFKDEDINGCGFCEVVDDIVVSRESCEEHCYYHNGWTEITTDNVETVRSVDVGRLMIAVITHGEPYYMEYREMFRELDEMAECGGYYYYVLPELKIE